MHHIPVSSTSTPLRMSKNSGCTSSSWLGWLSHQWETQHWPSKPQSSLSALPCPSRVRPPRRSGAGWYQISWTQWHRCSPHVSCSSLTLHRPPSWHNFSWIAPLSTFLTPSVFQLTTQPFLPSLMYLEIGHFQLVLPGHACWNFWKNEIGRRPSFYTVTSYCMPRSISLKPGISRSIWTIIWTVWYNID